MLGPRLLYAVWLGAARRHHRAYSAALAAPEAAQQRLLRRLLRANGESRFGRGHGFAGIDSVAAFRRKVPLQTYAELEPELADLRAGVPCVLTREPPLRLLPSGGSTGAPKLLPSTRSSARAVAAAVGAWMVDLASQVPAIRSGPAYWSVSPAFELPPLPSAVPIGFDEDAAHLGRLLAPIVARTLVAPAALRLARPLAAFKYTSLRLLLAARELRLLSVWHPSFLELLLAVRAEHWDRLLEDVCAGTSTPPVPLERDLPGLGRFRPDPRRAAELASLGPNAPVAALWPKLALVSAWGDAAARSPFAELARMVAPALAQPKGLISTEAFVSLPFAGQFPLALLSTFIELLDESGRVFGAHEVETGGVYEVVVTTAAGLYRYRLGDLVEVVGRLGATPSVRFVGRADRVVDRVGEKLSDAFVGRALAGAFGDEPPPPFALLAPEGGRYVLFLDRPPRDLPALRSRLAAALRENAHYAYAEDLGQLGKLEVEVAAPDAGARFIAHRHCRGQGLGDVKACHLADEDAWSEVLGSRRAP